MSNGPGFFELLIKVYFANEHPNFPKGGVMSQALDRLKACSTFYPLHVLHPLPDGYTIVRPVVSSG